MTAHDTRDRDANDRVRPVLRYGWLAKGAVFVIIGLLSLELVRRGYSSEDADQQGALEALSTAPVGRVAVLAVSAGLLLYAIWQVWSAVVQDGDDNGEVDDAIHQLKRVGWVGLAGVYALLASTGISISLKGEPAAEGDTDGPTTPTGLSSRLFELPGGRVLVAIIGIGTIGVALYQLRKGARRDFLDDIDTAGVASGQRRLLTILGAAGFAARAMLMGTAGWLFIDAALVHNADRAAGLDESLRTLTAAPGGQLLLAATGLGLIAAGAYDMTTFRRQRIDEA